MSSSSFQISSFTSQAITGLENARALAINNRTPLTQRWFELFDEAMKNKKKLENLQRTVSSGRSDVADMRQLKEKEGILRTALDKSRAELTEAKQKWELAKRSKEEHMIEKMSLTEQDTRRMRAILSETARIRGQTAILQGKLMAANAELAQLKYRHEKLPSKSEMRAQALADLKSRHRKGSEWTKGEVINKLQAATDMLKELRREYLKQSKAMSLAEAELEDVKRIEMEVLRDFDECIRTAERVDSVGMFSDAFESTDATHSFSF